MWLEINKLVQPEHCPGVTAAPYAALTLPLHARHRITVAVVGI
jgi:hypothetical protein